MKQAFFRIVSSLLVIVALAFVLWIAMDTTPQPPPKTSVPVAPVGKEENSLKDFKIN